MIRSNWLISQMTFLAMLAFVAVTACVHTTSQGPTALQHHEDSLEIQPVGAPKVSLRSRWIEGDAKLSLKTTVIIVPGSGNQTLEVGSVWQESLARAGYDVFAYDKRLGTTGPSALANDVDAACVAVSNHFGAGRKTILWTSEQGTQVVLNSNCLLRAQALVIISPIPDALDRVWISGLKEAGMRDRAESLSATFDSIKKGLFEPDAKIMGASLSFWKNWLQLAANTPKQMENINIPILFAAGEEDVLLGRYGRRVLDQMVRLKKNRKFIVIPNADRNLMQKESLSPATVETILGALGVLGKQNG